MSDGSPLHRVLRAYARLHPAMHSQVTWRMSMGTADAIAEAAATAVTHGESGTHIFGIPVELIDGNDSEILLIVKA